MADRSLQPAGGEDVRVLGMLVVLIRERRLILAVAAAFVALAVAIVAFGPKSFSARTVVVQAQVRQSSAAQALLAQLPSGLGSLGPLGGDDQREILAVLSSESIADSLVNALAVTGAEADEVRTVLDAAKVRQTPEGALAIVVTANEPKLALTIANTMPKLANAIMSHLSADAALHKQAFLEQQLAQARARLDASEQQMVRFQESRSAPELQEQAQHTLEAAAALQQKVLEQEVKVGQMRRTATPDNPELQQALTTLGLLRHQLSALGSGEHGDGSIFLPIQGSPELKASAERLAHTVAADQQLYSSLAMALAQTQIDAQSNLPVLTVLDRAKKASPSRRAPLPIAVGLALFLGLIFGVIAAFFRSYMRAARLDPGNDDFFRSLEEMRTGFGRLRPISLPLAKRRVARH